eukprot:275004-Ditylum_brightwellii.AAC.3
MLIIDCGASASFTYDKSNFISYKPFQGKVQGLDVQLLVSNTYHIPDILSRLLCPQQVAQQSRDPLAG